MVDQIQLMMRTIFPDAVNQTLDGLTDLRIVEFVEAGFVVRIAVDVRGAQRRIFWSALWCGRHDDESCVMVGFFFSGGKLLRAGCGRGKKGGKEDGKVEDGNFDRRPLHDQAPACNRG